MFAMSCTAPGRSQPEPCRESATGGKTAGIQGPRVDLSSSRRCLAGIGLFAAGFAPNPPIACLVALAALVEFICLAKAEDSILAVRPHASATTAFFLLAIWIHLGYLIWACTVIVDRASAFFGRRVRDAAQTLLALSVLGAAGLYLSSWGLFSRTGRFTNLETVEFAIHNSGESWLVSYLLTSERPQLIAFCLVLAVVGVLLPRYLRRVAKSQWSIYAHVRPWCAVASRLGAWLLVMQLVLGANASYRTDASTIRRGLWRDAVANRLNPALTLVAGAISAHARVPVEPILDAGTLAPLSSDVTQGFEASPPPAYSVVFVAIESLRSDVVLLSHQGREITPNLNRFARRGLHFRRAYTQSTHSDYADMCIVSSLYPLRSTSHHYYRASDPWSKTLIYDVLKPLGFATANISSSNETWGGMDQFLASPNLDLYYDAERSRAPTRLDERDIGFANEVRSGAMRRGSLDDAHTVDRAISWIREQTAAGRRFFLNMSFQNSHFSYALPPDRPRPFQPGEIDFDASFARFPRDKTPIVRNAYYNAIHDCDQQLGRFIQALEACDQLDKTILVVMGENGEAFYENGIVCHAGLPREPALRVGLVIHAPALANPATIDYPTELVDVVPTVFGLLGWKSHPNFQGLDVLADDRPDLRDRLLFFHVENPLVSSDALLYQDRWKFIHVRATDSYELFDLAEDPREQENLIDRKPRLAAQLRATLATWRAQQLAYYHFPQYYLKYYPPRPPRLVTGR
jgi:arylsulfatase A-like enzyme